MPGRKAGKGLLMVGHKKLPHGSDGVNREDHVVLECFFLPCNLGSRRDFAGKKRGERTLAGGP